MDMARSRGHELADPGVCPKCAGEMRDMREYAYHPDAMREAGICFRWADDMFECVHAELAE